MALCNQVYVVCTHPLCFFLNICERASKGKALLAFLNAWMKTTPTEPFLHRTASMGPDWSGLPNDLSKCSPYFEHYQTPACYLYWIYSLPPPWVPQFRNNVNLCQEAVGAVCVVHSWPNPSPHADLGLVYVAKVIPSGIKDGLVAFSTKIL